MWVWGVFNFASLFWFSISSVARTAEELELCFKLSKQHSDLDRRIAAALASASLTPPFVLTELDAEADALHPLSVLESAAVLSARFWLELVRGVSSLG